MPALQYQLLEQDHTPALVSLVRACYGEHYAHAHFYDAAALADRIRREQLFCAIATDAQGQVVATMSVGLEYPGDRTADNFAGMMLPEYRGQGVLMQLGAILFPVYERLQLYGLQTATVTHHTISQKISSNTGTQTCGCLLADSPGSNADGLPLTTRMPILMQFYRFQAPPSRPLYLPAAYGPLLTRLFDALAFPVTAGSDAATPPSHSRVEWRDDPRRGTRLLRCHAIGNDMAALLEQHRRQPAAASYLDIPLTDPAAPALSALANRDGWFFGGLLLERAGTDFLRLQRCDLPQPDSRQGIVDAFSQSLVDAILQDRERTCHRSPA